MVVRHDSFRHFREPSLHQKSLRVGRKSHRLDAVGWITGIDWNEDAICLQYSYDGGDQLNPVLNEYRND